MKTKKLFSVSILILIVGLFAYYIYTHISDFKQIELINPLWLIPLVLLFILNYYFLGIQTKNLLLPLDVKLKNLEAFMLSIVTGFYNLITPAHGGMAVRAVYLKKKHGFAYTNFFSSLAGIYVISFFISSLFGLISLFFIYQLYNIFNWIIFLIFLGLFLLLLGVIIFSPEFKERSNKLFNRFVKVANGWNLISKDKRIILVCSFVTIMSLIINSISTIISYHIFGINLNIIQALFLTCISSIGILLLITPGNLGVAEAIAVFSALILGITPFQSLSVAVLGRIIQLLSLSILGPIFSYILLKHQPKNETNL